MSTKTMKEVREMLCEELDNYARRKITMGDLSTIDTLAHAIKNLDKAMQGNEDAQSMRGYAMDGQSYGMHYVRGHYSRDGGESYAEDSYNGYSQDGYSRAANDMVGKLRGMMRNASPKEQDALRRCIDSIER